MTGKSPLRARPLRNPGESIDKEIDSWINDSAGGYLVTAAMLCFLAMMEWFGYLTKSPRQPILYSIMAALAVVAFGVKFVFVRRRVRNLRLGRDGERCVGQFLERLREDEAQIFHDVPGQGFNLDHVVISPNGIYVVETKTFSKPFSDARVVADNNRLLVAGRSLDKDPVVQATAAARWLKELLKESTGKAFAIRPTVVFPGWFVEQPEPRGEVWVLEPKMLPALIAAERVQLSISDVKLAAFHLSRYIRAEAEKPPGKRWS